MRYVRGLELIEMSSQRPAVASAEPSVKYPEISTAMAEDKAATIAQTGADYRRE
jgi:hypothetical protein